MKYALIALLLITGCTNPPTISNQGAGATVAQAVAPPDSQIAVGLKNAASNLDQAIGIGILQADDPADACVHNALKLSGLESTPGSAAVQSFTPVISDAISAGSVLYIQSVQLRNAKPFSVDTACKAVLGDLVLQGLQVGARLTPGIRLLQR